MPMFQLTIVGSEGDPSAIYRAIDDAYTDDEIINISGKPDWCHDNSYDVSNWHRELFKTFRSLGVLIICFDNADSVDIDFMSDFFGNITTT